MGPPLKGGIRGGGHPSDWGSSDCYHALIDPQGQHDVIESFPSLGLLACHKVPVQQSGRRRQARSKPPDRSAAAGLWSARLRPWRLLSVAFGGSSRADPGAQARRSLGSSPGHCPWPALCWPQATWPDPHKLPEPYQRLRLCPHPWTAPTVPRQSRWLNHCEVCTCQVTSTFGPQGIELGWLLRA